MMRIFINLFLTGFALDAAISAVDDVSGLLLGRDAIGAPRDVLALAVLFLSPLVYIACGLDSRLPKLLLLPPAVFAVWAGFGALPFGLYIEDTRLMPVLSLSQLGLAACVLLYIRKKTGDWLLAPEYFARPGWRLKNTLAFALGNLLLIPALLVLLLAGSAYGYLRQNTGGFLRLGADGVHVQEHSYTRDGQTVRLLPMIHIGSAAYYRELGELLSRGDALVLAEGVSDEAGLLENSLSYSKMADFIGLDVQENMPLEGRVLEQEALGTPETAGEAGIVRADIDSSELSEQTRQFIENAGAVFNTEDSFLESLNRYNAWYEANMTPEQEQAVFAEIIDKRNETLLGHLDRALLGHDLIVIPWGALHMPGIERGLLDRGFTQAGSTSRLAIAFKDLFENTADAPAAESGAGP